MMRWWQRLAMVTAGVAAALTLATPGTAGVGEDRSAKVAVVTMGDAQPTVPSDFANIMGYAPKPAQLADGSTRLVNPAGSCSVPGDGYPFPFATACQVHDYGYDLLRYAEHKGRPLGPDARESIDDLLTRDLHTQCSADPSQSACEATVSVFSAAVMFNSWRQVSGPPIDESGLPRTAGLILLPAALLLLITRGRRRSEPTGSARLELPRLSADPVA